MRNWAIVGLLVSYISNGGGNYYTLSRLCRLFSATFAGLQVITRLESLTICVIVSAYSGTSGNAEISSLAETRNICFAMDFEFNLWYYLPKYLSLNTDLCPSFYLRVDSFISWFSNSNILGVRKPQSYYD